MKQSSLYLIYFSIHAQSPGPTYLLILGTYGHSWTAKDITKVRPTLIEWESTSGLKNIKNVEFVPQNNSSGTTTQMTLCFKFVAPRFLSALIRRSGKIRKYTEDVLLTNMLNDFRDVVMKEDL